MDGTTYGATVDGTRVNMGGVPLTRNDIVAANGIAQLAGGFFAPPA